MNKKRKYSVPAIDNAFRILRLLSRERFRNSTLTEIASALSLNTATCYRLLKKLEELSIVRFKRENKKYTLGPYLIVLGERAKAHLDYISIIKPHLQKLSKDTGLTSTLIGKVGESRLTILLKEEGDEYGITVSVGRHFSIVDGSYGNCFLAYMSGEERQYFLEKESGLREFTDVSMVQLEEEFAFIRENGFSRTYGEYIKGVFGVSAPIFNSNGEVEMAISLFGLTAQVSREQLHELGKELKKQADDITAQISGRS